MNLIKGFFGQGVSAMERQNPEALLEVERENLKQLEVDFNRSLASQAALSEKLMAQVGHLRGREDALRRQTKAALDSEQRERAGQLALQLKSVRGELDGNESQLEDAETAYKDLLGTRDKAIQKAQEKIREIAATIKEVQVQERTAELAERTSGVTREIGDSADTLNRLQDMVEERRQQASARQRVARDSRPQLEDDPNEAEQAALADAALAEFEASEGIEVEISPPPKRIAEGEGPGNA
ncbi:MAG: hypothetical protein AAGK14_01270 [Verrucomicrobiota bacterium]